jgi:hypothetical protein
MVCERGYPKYVCSPQVKAWNCNLCYSHIAKIEKQIQDAWKVREIGS